MYVCKKYPSCEGAQVHAIIGSHQFGDVCPDCEDFIYLHIIFMNCKLRGKYVGKNVINAMTTKFYYL